MSDTNATAPRPARRSYDTAFTYGHAALQSGFAFARAGVRSVGAFVEAGMETVAAFAAARRPPDDPAGG